MKDLSGLPHSSIHFRGASRSKQRDSKEAYRELKDMMGEDAFKKALDPIGRI